MRLNANIIDVCHDCRDGLRNAPANGDLDIETITDQLCELRDVLENMFKAATTPVGAASLALTSRDPSALVVNELLSRCQKDMSEMQIALKQEIGRERTRSPSSSLDSEVILGNLTMSTTALRDLMDGNQAYDARSFGKNLTLIIETKVP